MRRRQRWSIAPHSGLRLLCDLLRAICTLYLAIAAPLRFCYTRDFSLFQVSVGDSGFAACSHPPVHVLLAYGRRACAVVAAG
jgi:hypothetical protein